MIAIKETAAGVQFAVRVVPGASRNEVAGVQDDALKVRLAAPAVEGKANRACIDFLAGLLGVRRSSLAIASGEKSRKKTVAVEGISRRELEARLEDLLGG
ncbi:MAG: YggU family protein [Syntrophaceae bacterium]|nr:YggU family protein [Syntrophaceae bacterium]